MCVCVACVNATVALRVNSSVSTEGLTSENNRADNRMADGKDTGENHSKHIWACMGVSQHLCAELYIIIYVYRRLTEMSS